MNSKIKVLFYEPYPMGLGGNFLTQKLILERLDPAVFEPVVLAPMDGAALDYFRSKGVRCVVMQPPGNISRYGGAVLRDGIFGKIKSVLNILKYNLRIYRFLKAEKVGVIYANCVRAEMNVGFAARLSGTPSVLYVKGELANPVIDCVCLILAKKIIFFCESNRDDKYPRFMKAIRKKIEIIGIGLDPALIDPVLESDREDLRREIGIDPNHLNTVVLAQLYPPKGQHFVIEALARIIKDFPNTRLYLLGDHVIEEYREYRKELEEQAQRLGIGENVIFLGWRKDALSIVKEMDLLIHPSLAEGFGRAVLESMALKKPVIVSAVGGLREAIVHGENGFLVQPGDVEAIAEYWKRLAGDKGLRKLLGEKARETIYRYYLIDDKVKDLSSLWFETAMEAST